jgi:hypothetical protein
MTNYEIVKKIIGPIKPIGSTEIDNERFENLKATMELADQLVSEIESIVSKAVIHEYSIKRASDCSAEFLFSLKDRI